MNSVKPALESVLDTSLRLAIRHLESLDCASVAPTADLRTLRARLNRPLLKDGVSADQVITDLAADVAGGIVGSAGGRFFGWVIGGTLPAALAADWLTSAWDQNAVLFASGPAAAVVEEVAGSWLKEILGLPEQASFAFVSGCQMAHVTCLAAARHELLTRGGCDVEQDGLCGAPRIRVLANAQKHGTLPRALRLLGFGRSQVVDLPTDSLGRLDLDAFEQMLGGDCSSPSIVILQAGDINTGAFDAFAKIIPKAKEYGAWVHVDGAFGLWAGASARYKHLVSGAELADSWATDGHKWLNVPYDCGYAFVAHPEAHRAAMSHRASYLTHDADARDQMDWSPEWSRRARGFPTYAALRQLGVNGVSALIERCCDYARALVTGIGALPGASVVCEPVLNQGLLEFLDPRPGATESDHARRTNEVIAAIQASGEAFFTGSDWNGQRVMRVSVCNWRTSDEDVDRVVKAVSNILANPATARATQIAD